MNIVSNTSDAKRYAELQEGMADLGYRLVITPERDGSATVFVENETSGFEALHTHPTVQAAVEDNEARLTHMRKP